MEGKYKVSPKGIFVPKTGSKTSMYIPWAFVNKVKVTRGLHRLTTKSHDKELYLVDMVINKVRHTKLCDEERDALKFIDIALIKSGREPKHVLKKQVK